MRTVHLIDSFDFTVLETQIPETLPRTVIWVDDVYLAHKIDDDGTPLYKLTTNYVVQDTHPSGAYRLPKLD